MLFTGSTIFCCVRVEERNLHGGLLFLCVIPGPVIPSQSVGGWCRWRTETHVNPVHLLAGGEENRSLDANCSWQAGDLTPPTKAQGPLPLRSAPVIEMEILEGVLEGEEVSHLTASQSVSSPCHYYYHFLSTLADNHSPAHLRFVS